MVTRFEIKGTCVFLDDTSLDLKGKKRLLDLFSVFIDTPNNMCSRELLIEKIYRPKAEGISKRQRLCYQQNVLKLVSRARKEARIAFNITSTLDWFVYHSDKECWRLYQRRSTSSLSSDTFIRR